MGLKKEINWDIVELYVKAGSKQVNLCKYLNIDEETLCSRVKEKYGLRWSEFSDKLRCEGEMMIEAKQYQKAMKDYWPALQWLGKIRCGQKEEFVNTLATNQSSLDQSHRIMQLEHELAELKANANKPKTE